MIADSGDHASILDGCLLSRRQDAPFRHNRLDLLEKRLKAAQEDGGGILVVVDGVYSMEGDVAPLPEIVALCKQYGARLMVDEAHGFGVLGARGAGDLRALRRRVRRRPADGDVLQVAGVVRRRDRGLSRGDRVPRIAARPFIFTASGVPAAVGATLAAVRICRSDEGRELFAKVLDNAAYLRRGLGELGFWVLPPAHMADGSEIVTPVVPVVVGDDWKAVFLWKALYEAGVFVNVAIHPAVPPAGALLRTSVMATHDRVVLDEALEIFKRAKQNFEAEHGPLPTSARVAADRCAEPHPGRGSSWRRSSGEAPQKFTL